MSVRFEASASHVAIVLQGQRRYIGHPKAFTGPVRRTANRSTDYRACIPGR